MAQFVFESDLHGLLKLDTPIPNAPLARWQRKAKESNASVAGPGPSPANTSTTGLSPMKPANRSHSTSKTPSKTPGESELGLVPLDVRRWVNGLGALRQPADCVGRGAPHKLSWVNTHFFRCFSTAFYKVPQDFLSLLQIQTNTDWTAKECINVTRALFSSPCTIREMAALNVSLQLWDIQQQKRLRNMTSHSSRVGSLSWNSYILSSGARTGHIHHHDVRVAEHHVATLAGHTQEVCGLKWSPDGRYLASGGNDNLVNVWPCAQGDSGDFAPVQTFTQHQGAVKAVAWCPWQSNVLATGGGTSDRHIRIWNVCSGTCLNAVDAHSQVCSILWSTNYKEFISGHGFAHNQLVVWKYPTMAKVTELKGHTARVLNLTMSPDGSIVASAAADETLRLWRCFEMDPVKKKEKAGSAKSSIIHQGIR
uniref:Cell division cycle 20 n=1 Tax=Chelydra serpentina TaxID=8475 RepID=A0A8C3T8E4_CHESE